MQIIHISIVMCLVYSCLSRQLVMIQQTFRHGARYPLDPKANDHSDIATKMNAVGQLTTQGKYMHYLLGKAIYQHYWDQLFKGTPYQNSYSQSQFYVKSTDYNRTLESAQAHLQGLLQNLPTLSLNKSNYKYSLPAWHSFRQVTNISDVFEIFESAPSFHPIPIHTQQQNASMCDGGDFLTKYDVGACPNQKFWSMQNLNSDSTLKIMRDQRIKEALGALSQEAGQDVEFDKLSDWISNHECLQYLDLPRLSIFDNPKYSEIFKFINVYSTYVKNYAQQDQIRAVSTDYFVKTLHTFEGKVSQTFTPRVVIYSGHDTTIGMLLAAMNFVNTQCLVDHYLNGVDNRETCIYEFPPFTANVIFQLWNNNGEYSIRILYNGDVKKIPFCDYKLECSLDEFRKWVNALAVQNVGSACGYVGNTKIYYAVIFLAVSAIVGLIAYVVFLHAKIRKIDTIGRAKRQGYVQNFQEKIEDRQQQMHSH